MEEEGSGAGSNKMHLGKNYQVFLKWVGVLFLGHSLIINELESFFPQNLI